MNARTLRKGVLAVFGASLVALAGPVIVRADDSEPSLEKPAKDGLAAVVRALFLVAAEKGAAQATPLAGSALTPELTRTLDAVAASPRAADLRANADDPSLARAFLRKLVEETPEAQETQRRLAEGGATRLVNELDELSKRATAAKSDGGILFAQAGEGKIQSPAALAAGKAGPPTGPLLARLARVEPYVRGELSRASDVSSLYRALAHAFERPVDANVERSLVLAAAVTKKGGAALDVVGGADAKKLVDAVAKRLDRCREATLAALAHARKSLTLLRQYELKQVVSGVRGADLEDALRLLGAYKRAFGDNPTLEATEVAGVYVDRSDRIYFYLEGEDRWVRGPEHAASPRAVTTFLFEAPDLELSRRATDPRALAALYGAFGDKLDFEKGMARVRDTALAVAGRVRSLEAAARKGGATREAFDAFLAEHAGYDRELAGPFDGLDDAGGAKRAQLRVAQAFVDGGPEAGLALVRSLDEAKESLAKVELLAFSGIKVTANDLAPGGIVTIRLEGGRFAEAPLVPPPVAAAPGDAIGCVLVAMPGDDPSGVTLEAEGSTATGAPLHARLALNVTAARSSGGAVTGGVLSLAKGASLAFEGGRTKLRAGDRALVTLSPARPARLRLVGPGDRAELAPWTAGGGVVAPLAFWPAGKWTAFAQDPESRRTIAQAEFEVVAAPGVLCEDAAGNRTVAAKPGEKVGVHLVAGGADLPGEATLVVEFETGGVAHVAKVAGPRGSLDLPKTLGPGRYRVRGKLGEAVLAPWPLAIVDAAPAVSLVRDPFALDAASTVGAGERLYARLEPGFALDPSEVTDALLHVRSPKGGAPISVRSLPVPDFGASALTFPLALPDSAPPGAWELEATITLPAGRVRALGAFQVAPGADLPFALRPADDGNATRTLFAQGERVLVRLEGDAAAVTTASFWVVGPDGLAAPVAVDARGELAFTVPRAAATGAWEVRGVAPGETVGRRAVAFQVYEPARFEAAVKGRAGEQAAVDLPLPPGYVEPVRVKTGRGSWVDGHKAIVVTIEAGEASIPAVLEDANGRRAEGRIKVEVVAEPKSEVSAAPAKRTGPQFAIVANVRERTFFFPDHESVSRMLRANRVPGDWVVVDSGPLSAAEVRDRAFEKLPYDGPRDATSSPLSVYRCVRFWSKLPAPVLQKFKAAGVKEATIFDVTNSPSPGGEETLEARARSVTDERGGWAWALDRVAVRAAGALPDATADEKTIRLQPVSLSKEASGVGRITCPGTLGDLVVRPVLPNRLVLGRPFSIAATAAVVGTGLVAGRSYPGELEKLAERTLLATVLEGTLEVEGRTLVLEPRVSLDKGSSGRELVFAATPVRTERADPAGPRLAEHALVEGAPAAKPVQAEMRFEPVPPGALANQPRKLSVRIKAKLALAVAPADWPAERPRPEPQMVAGAPFLLGPVDVPPVEVEIEATYLRFAEDGAPERPQPPAALGDLALGVDGPLELAPVDVSGALARALQASRDGKLEEWEAAARAALVGAPERPEPWSTLGEAVLQRGRPDEALLLLSRASELDEKGARPLVLLGEAYVLVGRMKDAREAARKASERGADAELKERIRKILGD